MARISPVEVTTKFATTVDTLQDAFEFIMDYVDVIGESPVISIAPHWVYSDTEDGKRIFEVCVTDMKET